MQKPHWLVLNVPKGLKIGDILSVENMGIHKALPDIWNNEKGYIKWNINGKSLKEIDDLKECIIKTLFRFGYE
jgi:hypothetical protein